MFDQFYLSAAQFVTALIAIAVALTGWVTLILANRRLRAERAILMIQTVRDVGSECCEIVIENVGSRAALDVVLAITDESKVVAGGLKAGDRITVRLPRIGMVTLTFRDAADNERRLSRVIVRGRDGLTLMPPVRPKLAKRLLIRSGFLTAE